MSLKSRFLRITLIVLLIVLAAGYFTFSSLLYSPTEDDLEVDVAVLIPRDVDFYVAKAKIGELFDPFPHLAVVKRLEKLPAWQAWVSSPECQKLLEESKLAASMAQLETMARELPLGLEPQEIFGGRDLAAAGYFKGRELNAADWAVYGRANWAGKLAAALLRYPNVLGLSKQGITATVEENYVKLTGGQLPRELFVTRVQDVVVIATKVELARAAHDLASKGFADSFHQSAAHFDHIQNANRNAEKDEFEVFVNTRKLFDNLKISGAWPNPKSQDFFPAFFGRLFQLGSVKEAIGVIGLDEGAAVDLHGGFSSEQITEDQRRVYRTRGFDQNQLLGEAARLAPSDTSLFVYLHADPGDVMRLMLESFEPALKTNLEDAFRNTGKYQSLAQLVTELDGALKDRFAVIVRPNDYPPDPEGPPNDGQPVPAVAIVLWTQHVDTVNALRELIGGQGVKFGLQGRKPGEPGYFRNTEAGHDTREFWSRFVPGTGVIATGNSGDLTIITNSIGMLGHLLKTYTQGGAKYPRLSEDPSFESLVHTSIERANALVWANPRTGAPILRQSAQRVAQDSIQIDWKLERARAEDQAIREQLPGKKRGELSPEDQAKVDEIVDPRLKSLEARIRAEQVPALMAAQERWITYLEAMQSALVMLALDPKAFELSIRAVVPLPPE
jgi:hypothetical protein